LLEALILHPIYINELSNYHGVTSVGTLLIAKKKKEKKRKKKHNLPSPLRTQSFNKQKYIVPSPETKLRGADKKNVNKKKTEKIYLRKNNIKKLE
jgi:hypothetical protein